MTELFLPKALGLLITPPGMIIAVALLGFLIQLKWVWAGNLLIAASFVMLVVLSLPSMGKRLLADIEGRTKALPAVIPEDLTKRAGAIVVLGAGRNTSALEYGGDTVNREALERLRYAAYLHRQTGLPVLVSGGAPYGEEVSEAALMKAVLERDFSVNVKWTEDRAANTMENAKNSKLILRDAGVGTVFLVTHAWHMPRAEWSFVQAGLGVLPAPTAFTRLSLADQKLLGFIPSARGLALSSLAISERAGLSWYKSQYEVQAILPAAEPKPAAAK